MKNTRKPMINSTASAATSYSAEQAAAIDKITQNCALLALFCRNPLGMPTR